MNAPPVPETWSPDELHRRYTTAPTVAIGRRYHALYLRRLGHGPGAVATLLGVSTQAIREWVTLATTAGLDRLARPAGGTGQAPKLTAVQQETVMGWLDVAPVGTCVTCKRGSWRRERSPFPPHRCGNWCGDTGGGRSCRAPGTTKPTWERGSGVKKVRQRVRAACKGRYRLLFLDEAWWGLTTQLRRVRTRRGVRPVQSVWGGRRWRAVMGAVEPRTGRIVSLLVGGLNHTWFSRFLALLAATFPDERPVLMPDNAGWHRSKDVVVPPTVTLVFQPPHSPEVNVMERVRQWLRGEHTRGRLQTSDEELDAVLCDALHDLDTHPARVRSLTN